MRSFLPFLGFVFAGEMIANFSELSVLINYLIGMIESIFYGYIFYHLSQRLLLKRIILFFVPASVAGYFTGYILQDKNFIYFIPNIVISGFFLATIALAYLYEKFADDDETFLISEPGFWIAAGVTLFYSGSSISFSLYDFILRHDLSIAGVKLYKIVPRVLSVILYVSISISLILCKKKNKISS